MNSKKILLVYIFAFTSCFAQAQSINKTLDSIINNTVIGKPQLIQITTHVIIDTFSIKKIELDRRDSSIAVFFSNNLDKKIKATNLWGQVTTFNERRRFYNGHTYIIWRTKTPYIYRVIINSSPTYYYSETLTSPIYPLNNESVAYNTNDSITKTLLNNYIIANKISNESNENPSNKIQVSKDSGDANKNEPLKNIVNKTVAATVDVTTTLYQSLVKIIQDDLFIQLLQDYNPK